CQRGANPVRFAVAAPVTGPCDSGFVGSTDGAPMGASPERKGAGMTPNELEGWVDRLGGHAMDVLGERDACPPTALVVVQGVPNATEMQLADDEDRALLRSYFEMAARGGAEACALLTEAWTARISATSRTLV